MTINELTKSFYPSDEEIEKIALCNFIDCYVEDIHNNVAVKNGLLRAGINSISDLANVSYEQVRCFRTIGKKRLDYVIDLKSKINDSLNNN